MGLLERRGRSRGGKVGEEFVDRFGDRGERRVYGWCNGGGELVGGFLIRGR